VIASPSASVDDTAQTSGRVVSAGSGLIDTVGTAGTEFCIVTVNELIAEPDAVPSLGVTRQYTVLPRRKYVPVNVDEVGAIAALLTYQA
jgi:hypothetical protein